MAIPQINQDQVDMLTSMIANLGAFSHVVPEESKDGKQSYDLAMENIRDIEQLLILGLVKEITETEDSKTKLATIYAMTNRFFRVFEITEVGRKMFSGVNERSVQ